MLECVVIGAGPAGLTAAFRLQQAGVDVHVLEREQRVGGRVLSSQWRQHYHANHGAQFLVGRPDVETPTMRLARDLGVATQPFMAAPLASFENGRWTVGETQAEYGARLAWPIMAKLSMLFTSWRMNRFSRALLREAQSEGARPVQSRLDAKSFAAVLGRPHRKVREFMEFTVSDLVSHRADDISGVQGVLCSDGMNSLILNVAEGGNAALFTELSQRLARPVTLGVEVESIENRPDHVELRVRQDGQTRVIRARHAVVAVPCDIVRDIVVDLPEPKRDALSYVSYGPYVTCAFLTNETDARPWDRYNNVIVHGLPATNAVIHQSFPQRQSEASREAGSVVLILSAAETAQQLLKLPDADIAAAMRADLLALYPDLANNIEEVRVVRWSRGIPAMRPGAYSKLEQMRSPFDRLHFCGDYLTYGPADMNAAIASAEAVALAVQRVSAGADPPTAAPVGA